MKKKNIIIFVIMLLIACLFTVSTKLIDQGAVGPENSVVGYSTINHWFNNLTGINDTWYNISEVLGFIPLAGVAVYGIIGLIQLIKRKSLLKVDKEIIALGVFYVIVLATYVLFEKVVINYRPVLIDGVLEASYPSSHTVLALCICGSSIMINNQLFKNKYTKIINIFCVVIGLAIVVGRILSGYHWLTDIVGGILISSTLLYAFNSVLTCKKN